MRRLRTFLFFTYPLLITATGFLLWQRYGQNRNKTEAHSAIEFRSNPHWAEQTEFYQLYQDSPKIIFLGTSLTARISWAEALDRSDAAGRGVNGDITAGILARVQYVAAAHPSVCFVEGGINDLDRNIAGEAIVQNLEATAIQLKTAGIVPVLTAIFPVTEAYAKGAAMNARIDSVNRRLAALCAANKWDFLSINDSLAPQGSRLPQYARGDGLHLTAAAYRIWISAANRILQQRGL